MHEIGAVEAVNIVPGGQDETAAQMLDAIYRAGVRRATHRFRFEHFLMRAGKRVNVQSALAVGNFPAKNVWGLSIGGAGQGQHSDGTPNHCSNSGYVHSDSLLFLLHGSTVSFMCMPSCSSLQITVQKIGRAH